MESEAPTTPSPDLLSINLDKLTPSNLKSDEELQRHSIDSSLEEKPIEKAIYFLTFGDDIQRLSVIQTLPDLYRQDPTGCSQKLIVKMQQCLPIASSDFHLATSVTIRSLMERKVIPLETIIQTFLQTILNGTEHRDLMVADAWVDCLIDIIPNLPQSVLQKDILQLVISKSAHQRPIGSRIACCRIIGALCKKYPNTEAKRDLLPIVLSLCQDVNLEVRAGAALQIPCVVRLLGSEISKNLLLPALVDLASDETPRVKEAAFAALVESIPFFSTDVIKTVVLPLLSQLVTYAFKYDNNMVLAIASIYGKMVTGLERVLQSSEKESYMKTYYSLYERCSSVKNLKGYKNPLKIGHPSGHGSALLVGDGAIRGRQYCAYNYPAMAKFLNTESETSRASFEELHRIFQEFLSDPSPNVRRAITVSLHEVVSIYGKYKHLLKPELCKAIKDNDDHVLASFMNHLGFILVNFKQLSHNQSDQHFDSEVVLALLACDVHLESSRNWRLHTSFIQQMEVLWYLFPTECIYHNFVPNFFKKLHINRALPIRMALVRTILTTLRYTPNEIYRMDVINSINELAVSQNFYDRMLFIRTCNIALEVFSTSYFMQYFIHKLLKMTADPVANIRWATCKLFPKLYSMSKLQSEGDILNDLESRLMTLSSDKDNEVLLMVQEVRAEIQKVGEEEEQNTDLFPMDQLKYEEEKKIFSLSQKLAQNFPTSCAKMFEPSIGGTRVMRKAPFEINESMSVTSESYSGSSELLVNKGASSSGSSTGKGHGNKGNLNSEPQPGFTDKEFFVDAGISLPLNTIQKIAPPKNNNYTNGGEKNGSNLSNGKEDSNPTNNVDGNKNNQNESKTSPKKKLIFRHSIPVRKKANPVEQSLVNKSDEIKNSTPQIPAVEKRHIGLRNVHRKNNSLGGVSQVDKRHSLELLDTEKRHSLEVVDINKNVTERSDSDVNCTGNAVQRRKKSQLPRPLSCVVLPVRTKVVEKSTSSSKLPVMRRT